MYQWQLMTVIQGGVATTPNKDFIKAKKHHIFQGSADCYDIYLSTIQL